MTTIAIINRGLWLFIAVVFLLAITTAVTYRTGQAAAMLYTACGIVWCVFMTWLSRRAQDDELSHTILTILTAMLTVFFFFESFVILPSGGYAILSDKNEIRLIENIAFIYPYRYKPIEYINDTKIESRASLTLTFDEEGKEVIKEVVWDIEAELELVADYNQAFSLLVRFNDKERWLSEVKKVVTEIAQEYISNLKTKDLLLKEFTFTLSGEQEIKLAQLGAQLGYKIKKIKADNIRFLLSH